MSTPNADLIKLSMQFVWHPCTQMKIHEKIPLLPIQKASGVWLYDFDGKPYLDAISSWWVNLFGHSEPRIQQAIIEQLGKIAHVMLAGTTHEPVVRLSEELSRLTKLGHAFYSSDGASSVEIALKMSFHFWKNNGYPKKTQFVCLQNSYHGETLGTLSVSDVALFKDVYSPLLRSCATLPVPDKRFVHEGWSEEEYISHCVEVAENYLAQHHADIASFIVEPIVQCAGGMAMYSAEYLKRIRVLCDRYQIHLIADEIAVGFGRTGKMFACEHAEILPDFMCLSKGITGGFLPLSVTLTTDSIFQSFYDDRISKGFLHSHSYTGNPLACAAALACLKIFETDDILKKNLEKVEQINLLFANMREMPLVKNFRQKGMIWAFELDVYRNSFAQDFCRKALEKGLLIRPICNTVYIMPPYVIEIDEAVWLVKTLVSLVKEFSEYSE